MVFRILATIFTWTCLIVSIVNQFLPWFIIILLVDFLFLLIITLYYALAHEYITIEKE